MESQIMVESLPLLGVCNLCLGEGAVQSLFGSYKNEKNKETFCEMLLKCFSIDVMVIDIGDTKRAVCDACAARLADAASFRRQVEGALQALEINANLQREKTAFVKTELSDSFADCDDAGFDEEDDLALRDVAIKKEPEEEPPPRRSKKKNQSKKEFNIIVKTSRAARILETESMLKSGLFPFKITRDKLFRCAICPEKSAELEHIKNHTKEHSIENIDYAFKNMFYLNSQRFYKNSTVLRCKICTTDLTNFEELKQHVDNCTRLKNYKLTKLPFKLEKDQLDCPVCKKTFLNFVSLNTHMNTHYPNFVCEHCGKAFASKARLRGHMRTHETGSFPCRYCDAVFDRVTKRENHVSKEHKAGVRYACKRCNISLTSFYARQKHLAEVHNEELKRYKCKACPQSYITPGHLSSHVRRDHLNERNHKCDKCDCEFYTKNALKMHMIKHDGERIHTCSVCNKSYQRKKTLREHMRIHTNDKRFVCPVCGRAFTQKCTLKGHLKVHERKVEIDDRIVALPEIIS